MPKNAFLGSHKHVQVFPYMLFQSPASFLASKQRANKTDKIPSKYTWCFIYSLLAFARSKMQHLPADGRCFV